MLTQLLKGMALAAIASAAAFAAPGANAADWPSDTVRIIVPWRAGGGTDLIARGIGAALEPYVDGKAVVIENITGGSGNAAHMDVKSANPDGLTLLLNGSSDLNTLLIFRKPPFGLSDFACVGAVYSTPTWMIANSEQGLNDLGDFIARAKEKPGQLTIGVSSLTSAHFVMAKAILGRNKIDARVIPFDGGGPLKKAILANQITAAVIHSPILLEEVKNGSVKVLATGGDLSGIEYAPIRGTKQISAWNTPAQIGVVRGVFAPKDTPPEVLAKAEAALEKAAKSPSFAEFSKKFGFAPIWMNGKEFCDYMQNENKEFSEIKRDFIDAK